MRSDRRRAQLRRNAGASGLEGLAWRGHLEERAGRYSGGSGQGTALKEGKQGVLGYIGYVSTMQGHLKTRFYLFHFFFQNTDT